MTAPDLFLGRAFSALDIVEVEPGTEIENNGEKLTVTDTAAVRKGRTIYVTAKVFAALRSIGEAP